MSGELEKHMGYTWYIMYLVLYTLCLLPQGEECTIVCDADPPMLAERTRAMAKRGPPLINIYACRCIL